MVEEKIRFFKIVEELSCVKELAEAYINQNSWSSLCKTVQYIDNIMNDLIEMSNYEPTEKEYDLVHIEARKKLGDHLGISLLTEDE